MSNQVPPGPGQPPYPGSEPPYDPYSSQAPGVPPVPPGSYPQGGEPSYGSEPSYGAGQQQGPGQQPYGQQPPYGQPSDPAYGPPAGGEQQTPYGYDPAQPGYGAAPGYQPQPGQGQYPPQGGYAPSYTGGPYPGAPKSGSGGKIVAIVAAAVVVVGLVVGGVLLLTKDDGGDAAASPSPSASRSTTSSTKPTPRPSRTSDPAESDPQSLAEAAFPAVPGYEYSCYEGSGEYDPVASAVCDNSAYEHYEILAWDDVASAGSAITGTYSAFVEVPWSGGTDYVWDATDSTTMGFYDVVRCYADAPVCVEVFEDDKAGAETSLSHLAYLDSAEITALNDWLAEVGI